MQRVSRFQVLCAANAVILACYWPLSHWLYADFYHRLFGFAPGTYDADMVRLIGTLGVMPVAGFAYTARHPAQGRAFLFAFMVWCFAMSATYLYVILCGRFPQREYFNAALLLIVGTSLLRAWRRAAAREAGGPAHPPASERGH